MAGWQSKDPSDQPKRAHGPDDCWDSSEAHPGVIGPRIGVPPGTDNGSVKTFISSLISGFGTFRDAAAAGVRALGYDPVRAEDFGASPASPQQTCLAGVRDADAVILLLGSEYGARQASGLSATHEEYREARDTKPVLVFIQDGVDPEPEQAAFIKEVQGWEHGHFTTNFTTADELREKVIRNLHDYTLVTEGSPLDEREIVERSLSMVPSDQGVSATRLIVAIAGGPRRAVLRPAELEDTGLRRFLLAEALTGVDAVLDHTHGTDFALHGDTIRLFENHGTALVSLSETGEILIDQPAVNDDAWQRRIPSLIEEDVTERIARALRFGARLLAHVDHAQRLSHVAPVAALLGAGYRPWRTREEHQRSPNAASMGSGSADPAVATLSPPTCRRPALIQDTHRIAEDLTVRLRREIRT